MATAAVAADFHSNFVKRRLDRRRSQVIGLDECPSPTLIARGAQFRRRFHRSNR
jgi:hypothetical protein